jgi:hypothetical protein
MLQDHAQNASDLYAKITDRLGKLAAQDRDVPPTVSTHLEILQEHFADLSALHGEAASELDEALESRRGYHPDDAAEVDGDGPRDHGPRGKAFKALSADEDYPTGL